VIGKILFANSQIFCKDNLRTGKFFGWRHLSYELIEKNPKTQNTCINCEFFDRIMYIFRNHMPTVTCESAVWDLLKSFCKNLRRIKKNHALRNPLIWCQMSKCPESGNFRAICLILYCFVWFYTRFEVFEFRILWDQISKCPEWVDFRLIGPLFSVFGHDNDRFVVFEFRIFWDFLQNVQNGCIFV